MFLESITNTRNGAQGINEPIHSYSAALGAWEFGTTQDKMLKDQLAGEIFCSVYLGTIAV